MSKRPDYESVKGCWDDPPRQQSGCSIAVAAPVLVALLVGAVVSAPSRAKADK